MDIKLKVLSFIKKIDDVIWFIEKADGQKMAINLWKLILFKKIVFRKLSKLDV